MEIFDGIIYTLGTLCFALIVYFAVCISYCYIRDVLNKQKRIKCLCKHEYEPYDAYYSYKGIEYTFKCRKCGKCIDIKTVSEDKFNWAE